MGGVDPIDLLAGSLYVLGVSGLLMALGAAIGLAALGVIRLGLWTRQQVTQHVLRRRFSALETQPVPALPAPTTPTMPTRRIDTVPLPHESHPLAPSTTRLPEWPVLPSPESPEPPAPVPALVAYQLDRLHRSPLEDGDRDENVEDALAALWMRTVPPMEHWRLDQLLRDRDAADPRRPLGYYGRSAHVRVNLERERREREGIPDSPESGPLVRLRVPSRDLQQAQDELLARKMALEVWLPELFGGEATILVWAIRDEE